MRTRIAKGRVAVAMLIVGIGLASFGYGLSGIFHNAAYWRSLGPNVAQSATSNIGFAILIYVIGPMFIGIGAKWLRVERIRK